MNINTSNFINLIGRLGDAPKTTTLPSGTVTTEFSLATNEYFRDRDGNRQTRTEWHRIKAYGKLAELFDRYLDRGQQLSVVGSMRYNKWVDKHDQARTSAEVVAQSFSFIGGGGGRQFDDQGTTPGMVADPAPEPTAAKTQRRRKSTVATPAEAVTATGNDDLPF